MSAMISVDQLKSRLGQTDLSLFDLRFSLADPESGRQDYAAGHIPGARYLHLEDDLSGPIEPHSGRHPLPSAQHFEALMRRHGVHSNHTIVCYDAQRFAFASRFWWMCRYFGHSRVLVLDGGLSAWTAAGNALSDQVDDVLPGQFKAVVQGQLCADRVEVMRIVDKGDRSLIDAREEKRFLGLEEPIDPIAGCIPTAQNQPWLNMTDAKGKLKSVGELQAIWQTTPLRDPVIYCGSGVTACVDVLALHEMGIESSMYPGSWSQWCSYMDNPSEKKP